MLALCAAVAVLDCSHAPTTLGEVVIGTRRGQQNVVDPATEIKARVGGRILRATLPGVDPAELLALPGVSGAESRGEAVVLTCTDSDAALRALLPAYPEARDIEVKGAGLEQAFLELTAAGVETDLEEQGTEAQR